MAADADIALRILDELDRGIAVVSADRERIVFANRAGREMLGKLGASGGRAPSSLRHITVGDGTRRWELRCAAGAPRIEVQARAFGDGLLFELDDLSRRDARVVRLLADRGLARHEARAATLACGGLRNRDIAARLRTTEGTVKNYLTRAFATLGVRSRAELVATVAAAAAGY